MIDIKNEREAIEYFRKIVEKVLPTINIQTENLIRSAIIKEVNYSTNTATVELVGTGQVLSNVGFASMLNLKTNERCVIATPDPKQRGQNFIIATYNNSSVQELKNKILNIRTSVIDYPRCFLRKSADQALPNATNTIATWNVVDIDTDGWYSGSATDRITVDKTGLYNIQATTSYVANAVGARFCTIYVNGTGILGGQSSWPTTSNTAVLTSSTIASLNAGDYITVNTFQSSGATLGLRSGSDNLGSALRVTRLA